MYTLVSRASIHSQESTRGLQAFQGSSFYTNVNVCNGKHPCRLKSWSMFKCPYPGHYSKSIQSVCWEMLHMYRSLMQHMEKNIISILKTCFSGKGCPSLIIHVMRIRKMLIILLFLALNWIIICCTRLPTVYLIRTSTISELNSIDCIFSVDLLRKHQCKWN